MSVKASIYDFFAFALPGALILLLLLHGAETFGWAIFYSRLIDSNFANWFVFGIASYLMGFILDPLFHFFTKWYKPLRVVKTDAYDGLVKRNKEINIRLNPEDWAIWFATIRRESLDLAYEIDRFNAQSKMMRGVCCATMLFVVLAVLYVLFGRTSATALWALPPAMAVGYLALRQARRFKMMFFLIIFETVVSRDEPFTKPSAKV